MAENTTPTVYVICDQNCKFEGMTKEQILAAIMQAVNEGTIGDIDAGFITKIKTVNNRTLRFFVGEQSQYDALSDEEKKNLFAIITNETTKEAVFEYLERLSAELEGEAAAREAADEAEKTAREAAVKGLDDKFKALYSYTDDETTLKRTFGIGTLLIAEEVCIASDDGEKRAKLSIGEVTNKLTYVPSGKILAAGGNINAKSVEGKWRCIGITGTRKNDVNLTVEEYLVQRIE